MRASSLLQVVLNVAGLGLVSAAAWVLHIAAGLAVAGVSFLLLARAAES